jgi:citrate lyase subunit beta/citryl-CoA lyase
MGTSDLVRDLRAAHTATREPLLYALSHAITVARARRLAIVDGVHLDFRNLETFRNSCEQGRAMGFDGRSLIHPGQVEIANETYGISSAAIEHARAVIAVWERAQAAGQGVVELDGQLIENLHAAEAQRLLAMSAEIAARNTRS